MWYFNRQIQDFRLRVYCLIFPLCYAVMFFYGMLNETRIFGELGGLMALVAALVFEWAGRPAPPEPCGTSCCKVRRATDRAARHDRKC